MDASVLVALGFSKIEAKTYLALLKAGSSTAASLAKKVSISRPNIYDALNQLMAHGLASYAIKNNKRFFQASPPEKILDFLREREERVREQQRIFQEALPVLQSLAAPSLPSVNVQVYEGREGTRTAFNDVLRECQKHPEKEMVCFGAASGEFRKLDPIFHQKHYAERERLGIKGRYLYHPGVDIVHSPTIQFRVLPEAHQSPAVTWVYGFKTSIWLKLEPEKWIGIVIENERLADAYREYFDLMWSAAKPEN
ncbi:MAG TPA: TrmB family transcriptional regulator [Candidatus Diapherotrites archaeon]|uniref:Helix-turn-helix domain-containing protein n=1 Tax=Candidatus Iainarchaeum sp. TaxID=3101447 RepID=A0A7J4JLB5_9ARCH|nr:helix-turn-helix domain-containing protein [Candidatus Diapherotrites archaeon]HIH16046.1 TrmB family transcriptional regulator [Candidatus Diapherotrites archaeon]